MGSNAQRKTTTRSLNFDGAGSKSMKRQKAASWESAELEPKSKKRFVGVRQRPSGRWVAEIKDTTQKIRLWLGTFDSAEEGAKAYDSAARALRGANTRTNFVTAIACEGAVPSKAARLIRLRQIAAANAKACEAEQKLGHGANPALRQDQSLSSLLPTDERHSQVTTPSRNISSSPPKPARRHNASAKPEHDGATKLDRFETLSSSPVITSETLSNAITHSLLAAAAPQGAHFSSLSRKSLETCNPTPKAEVPLVHNPVQLAATGTHSDGSEQRPPPSETSCANLAAPPPQQQSFPCSSTRADVSLPATCASDGADTKRPLFIADAESSLHSCESTSTSLESGSSDAIPWSEYVLVDGLDLTPCETTCGVYASAFDFSAEAMDRDSCASSVLQLEDQQYLSDVDSTEFLLPPMPESIEPALSPGAHSSGSTDSMDADGECSSPEQEQALIWSAMSLPPLCMRS